MGPLPVWKGATMTTIQIQNNLWSLEHCLVLHIVHFAAPFAQKCDHLPPPPNPYISETAFSHRFQKVYTTPPPAGRNFGAFGPKVQKCQNPPCWRIPRDMPLLLFVQLFTNSPGLVEPITQKKIVHNEVIVELRCPKFTKKTKSKKAIHESFPERQMSSQSSQSAKTGFINSIMQCLIVMVLQWYSRI